MLTLDDTYRLLVEWRGRSVRADLGSVSAALGVLTRVDFDPSGPESTADRGDVPALTLWFGSPDEDDADLRWLDVSAEGFLAAFPDDGPAAPGVRIALRSAPSLRLAVQP